MTRLWVRMGDGDEYHCYDSVFEVADALKEAGVSRDIQQCNGGITHSGYRHYNYISLYWGDRHGEMTRDVNHEEFRRLVRLLTEEGVSMSAVVKRCFQFVDSSRNHNKFWTVEIVGRVCLTTYGRIGSRGATQTKEFNSERECRDKTGKKINEQLREGYNEVGSNAHPGAPPVTLAALTGEGHSEDVPEPRRSSKVSSRKNTRPVEGDRHLDL